MRALIFPLVLVPALATGASAQSSGKLSVSVTGVRNEAGPLYNVNSHDISAA